MTREEWNDLAAALGESWKQSGASVPGDNVSAAASEDTVEEIVQRVAGIVTDSRTREAENQRPSRSTSSSSSASAASKSSGAFDGSDILRTVGMVTGIGPVATALIKLFGHSGDDKSDLPEPVKYTLPPALAVTAGLTDSRSLTQISYAQGDRVRADEPVTSRAVPPSTPAAPTIQIHVDAMDSRSFMDRSDEIAQAVRAAMLRSHALNDVVSEL